MNDQPRLYAFFVGGFTVAGDLSGVTGFVSAADEADAAARAKARVLAEVPAGHPARPSLGRAVWAWEVPEGEMVRALARRGVIAPAVGPPGAGAGEGKGGIGVNHQQALIAQIFATPDEDDLRLIYADCLEEEARALVPGEKECRRCRGTGSVVDHVPSFATTFDPGDTTTVVSPGGQWLGRCPECHGSGTVPDTAARDALLARAEFIRVQYELAALHGKCPTTVSGLEPFSSIFCRIPGSECRECTLRRRERELLEANVESWSCWPTGWVRDGPEIERGFHGWRLDGTEVVYDRGGEPGRPLWRRCLFRRGFVHAVTCTARDWLAHAGRLVWPPTVKCGKCLGGLNLACKPYNPAMGPPGVPGTGDPARARLPKCDGTGRVPNPDPPTTHQPVVTVTITDLTTNDSEHDEFDRVWELARKHGLDWRPGDGPERWLRVFRAEWPRIQFG